MRIVLATPEYPPTGPTGGVGTNAATTARALVARGHEVCVVTRGDGRAYTDQGVQVVRLRRRWVPSPTLERLLANRMTGAAARRFRPDIVQAVEYEAEAWWLARWTSIPVVTRLATPTYILEELNGWRDNERRRLVRRLERDQAHRSAAVLAPTFAIAERVAADWGLEKGSVDVIRNPVDIEAVRKAGASEPSRPLPKRPLVFIGRLERRKGIEELGAALPDVLEAHPDVEAILIGRDPSEEEGALMERFWTAVGSVRERVHVVGELGFEDAMATVARAELVVLPSLWESFGYVAVEAMALGRPVVATRAGGLADTIEDEETGWLVTPGRSDELAAALKARLRDSAGLRRVGEAARRRAEDFGVDVVIDEVVALYERVLEHDRASFKPSIYKQGYRRYFKADDRADPFHRLYQAKRDAVVTHFAGLQRMRVLDVGGGYGRLAAPLAQWHDVTLCDLSPEMLDEARRRCPADVRIVAADARELPFADGEFDAVIAVDLVVHLPNLRNGIGELARVVRPGGEVIFDTTNAAPWWVLAYPAYVNWRPRRLLATMRAQGVLPEWREIVRHQRADEVRAAIASFDLRLRESQAFGPRWAAKWHLWWTSKP